MLLSFLSVALLVPFIESAKVGDDFRQALQQNRSLTWIDYSGTAMRPSLDSSRIASTAHCPPPSNQAQVNHINKGITPNQLKTQLLGFTQHLNRWCLYDPSGNDTMPPGLIASRWLTSTLQDIASTRPDLKITIEARNHSLDWDPFWIQETVILRIPSSAPDSPRTILGAHIDTWREDVETVWDNQFARAEGADDNASGSTNILIALRELLKAQHGKWTPKTPLEFHWYSCEEYGILGSELVSREYVENGIAVKGMLQFDMSLYTKPGVAPEMAVVTDYTSPTLNDYIIQLIDEYVDIPYTTTPLEGGLSDHYSWNDKGYPASFVFEALDENANHNTHSGADVLAVEGSTFEQSLEWTKLAVAFAYEMTAA